jgi:hypothetical protein
MQDIYNWQSQWHLDILLESITFLKQGPFGELSTHLETVKPVKRTLVNMYSACI